MATNQKTRQRTPWENWGISKVEFDVFIAKGKASQANAPKQGTPAPDFEIERLDDHGKQTGQMFRLSSDFGKPIALIFGSYT